MASFTLTDFNTTELTLLTGETGVITATGGQLGSITMGDAVLLNHGTLLGGRIQFQANHAYIENHGSMTGEGSVIDAFSFSLSAELQLEIVNHGTITGWGTGSAAAIFTSSSGLRVFNQGTITGTNSPAIEVYDVTGAATGTVILNDGLIQSAGFGFAIWVDNEGTDRVQNTGRIIGGVSLNFGADHVHNSGTIDGQVQFGQSSGGTLRNSGTITGDVVFFGGNSTVVNMGTINGRITGSVQTETFDLRGGVVREGVFDQGGDDLYLIDDPTVEITDNGGAQDRVLSWASWAMGSGIEQLTLRGTAVEGRGNALANTIAGNGSDNRLAGGEGHDTVSGGAGDDVLRGDLGSDQLSGEDGDDTVRGGSSSDTLSGGEGEDTLLGDGGNDRLTGDNGADLLVGGAGRDTMAGGADADQFRFRWVSDSGVGAALRDQITGFETGLDLIDLSEMDANAAAAGNQAFSWIGAAAFGTQAGQLRLVTGANSVLQGDVGGDGVADFEVQLTGVTGVGVNDILL